MQQKIILSADSSCDLGPALLSEHQVHLFPFTVLLDGNAYSDGIDITPDDIYHTWWNKKVLPTTAAVNENQYDSHFRQWTEQGYAVIHISLASALSSAYQNACLAAQSLPNVYVIDSCSLSTGSGLLVLQAADRIARGMEAEQIYREVSALTQKTQASFLLDTLEFMHAGGRCSSVAKLGVNMLHIKPCIQVHPDDSGSMGMGKLYRGKLDRCLQKYVRDVLAHPEQIDTSRAFITHSGIDDAILQAVFHTVSELVPFEHIYTTRAGCTVSSHCGPNTLGVLYLRK